MTDASIDWENSRPHEISAALAAVQVDRLDRVVIVRAGDMGSAIVSMDWKHELALLGSARLARRGLLFLGPTANKIMRNLPVPLVAVPSAPEGGEET